MRNRENVIARFCALSGVVGQYKYKWRYASDCFCQRSKQEKEHISGFVYDEVIFDFIVKAVLFYLYITSPRLFLKRRAIRAFLRENTKHHLA